MTIATIAIAALAILALLGFALVPLMLASGLWAHSTAGDHRAQAADIDRMLADD